MTTAAPVIEPRSKSLIGRPRVACYCDTDLVHSSHAVTGLIELADSGEIELCFRLRDRNLDRDRGVWTLWLRVSGGDGDGDERGICIDCHDAPEYLCQSSLAHCSAYYKSNLGPASFEAAPAEFRDKLRPFGPYLPCRPRRDRALLRRWFGNLSAKFKHRFFVASKPAGLWKKFRTFAPQVVRHRRYLSRGTWAAYESEPAEGVPSDGPLVFFNPSCWDETEATSIAPLNRMRSDLILALRRELGDRFVGGFRRHGNDWQKYAEAAEPRVYPHDEYLRLVRACPLLIYVNGKWGCFSWRLPENFAAGKCMVAEPFANDAGFPLDDSAGIVVCNSVPDMVAAVRALLADPSRLAEYQRRARRTYLEHMRPIVRMRNVLMETLETSSAAQAAALGKA